MILGSLLGSVIEVTPAVEGGGPFTCTDFSVGDDGRTALPA